MLSALSGTKLKKKKKSICIAKAQIQKALLSLINILKLKVFKWSFTFHPL
jgi:hypothetical protein